MGDIVNKIFIPLNNIVWGPFMLVLLLGIGLFLMIALKFQPIRKIPTSFALLWKGRARGDRNTGELSPYKALMTALAATIGTGNIAGVATAIFLGGPGAVFWMWCTALVGMATKFAEAVLAVKYREVTPDGSFVGGPMYYIKNGLGKNWGWLAFAFAFFGCIAGFGIGNTVQVNSIAEVLRGSFGVPPVYTAVILFVLVFLVLIGGVQRIGNVAGSVVPAMAVFYTIAAIICLIIKIDAIPQAFSLIFSEAFNPTAAGGGITGGVLMLTMRYGIARGVFSNEAGLGSAPIAHATARTNNPIRQGMIATLGTFLDTIVVCTMTAMVILVSGVWQKAPDLHTAMIRPYIEQHQTVLVKDGKLDKPALLQLFHNIQREETGKTGLLPVNTDFDFQNLENLINANENILVKNGALDLTELTNELSKNVYVTKANLVLKNNAAILTTNNALNIPKVMELLQKDLSNNFDMNDIHNILIANKDKVFDDAGHFDVNKLSTILEKATNVGATILHVKQGAELTSISFAVCLPGSAGHYIVAIGLSLFAFTTILGWCVYSERCAVYLFGYKALKPFRIIYSLAVPVGALATLNSVWLIADTFNALMAIPNIIGLILLSGVVIRMANSYFKHGEHTTEINDKKLSN